VDEPLMRYRIHDRNGVHERDAMLGELAGALRASVRRRRIAT
jgi:hypothetical protein